MTRRVVWVALGALLLSKMILLEPLVVSVWGLRMVLVAALLPPALLLRWAGVGLITAACGVAHWLNDADPVLASIVAGAVAIAVGGAHVLLGEGSGVRWLGAGWSMTAIFSLTLAGFQARFLGENFAAVMMAVFGGVWLPLNLVGIPIALLLARGLSGMWPARRTPSLRGTES